MKHLACIAILVVMAGCSGSDAGQDIPAPPPKPTAEQMQSMPPEAQQAMSNAEKAGQYQSQRMADMAAAQRAAGK